MDGAELFSRCLAQTTGVVRQVRPEHLANATPCADWHVWDLVDYMVSELAVVAPLLSGKVMKVADASEAEIEMSGAADPDVDIGDEWQLLADAAEAAAMEADPDGLAHPADGTLSNGEYLRRLATDLLVQAWSLAVAIGLPFIFDPGAAQAAYDYAVVLPSRVQPEACAAEPIPVAATASVQTKLLALYGRFPTWQATI